MSNLRNWNLIITAFYNVGKLSHLSHLSYSSYSSYLSYLLVLIIFLILFVLLNWLTIKQFTISCCFLDYTSAANNIGINRLISTLVYWYQIWWSHYLSDHIMRWCINYLYCLKINIRLLLSDLVVPLPKWSHYALVY